MTLVFLCGANWNLPLPAAAFVFLPKQRLERWIYILGIKLYIYIWIYIFCHFCHNLTDRPETPVKAIFCKDFALLLSVFKLCIFWCHFCFFLCSCCCAEFWISLCECGVKSCLRVSPARYFYLLFCHPDLRSPSSLPKIPSLMELHGEYTVGWRRNNWSREHPPLLQKDYHIYSQYFRNQNFLYIF